MPKGKVIKIATQRQAASEPTANVDQSHAESESAASTRRRRIYIKGRLPAVLAEIKSVADEKKQLMAKRNEAQPEERKQFSRRLNFLAERLAVLREERAALTGENQRYAREPAKKEA